nr:DUF3152 domain-containing protein [Actinacidiphila rubida]
MADRRRQRSRGRSTRRAAIAAFIAACVVALCCGVGYAAWDSRHGGSAAALEDGMSAATTPPAGASDVEGSLPGTATATTPTPTRTTPSPTPTPTKTAPPKVPNSGSGTFTTARANGTASGQGRIRRYKVQVEGGIDLSSSAAAQEIAQILANPRGWTADGHDGFQLVSSGYADFVIKIATPNTVDAICGQAGLLTHGEVNCDVGATVVVNLKRWMLGSPEFSGPIGEYRALIINHEVGHRIGHGHEACPGPGKLAPVMMQQIKGLHGCIANAWPYDSAGHYIQGPPTA